MSLSSREHQLLQALVVLAIVYLALQVFALGWVAFGQVADVIIIFVAAWALAYLLSPLVKSIDAETALNRTLSVVVVYVAIAPALTRPKASILAAISSGIYQKRSLTVAQQPANLSLCD